MFFITNSVDNAWNNLKNIFISVLYSVAPVQGIRIQQRLEPWLTSEIIELMKERDRLLYMFRKQKTSELYKTYCSYRNKVQRNINQANADYMSNKM